MKRSKPKTKPQKNAKTKSVGRAKKASQPRSQAPKKRNSRPRDAKPESSTTTAPQKDKADFRIADCLRDSRGFQHIEKGCQDQLERMIRNYQEWAKKYLYGVRLALMIPGIETYSPPSDYATRFWDHIMDFDMRKPHTVLEIALERLGALHMLDHLPGGRDFERAELPRYVHRRMKTLDRNKVIEAALTCLDVLVIAKYRDGLPIDWDTTGIKLWPTRQE